MSGGKRNEKAGHLNCTNRKRGRDVVENEPKQEKNIGKKEG